MALSDHSPKMRLPQAHGDGEFDRMPGKTPNTIWYCSDQQRHDTMGALGNPHVHTSTRPHAQFRSIDGAGSGFYARVLPEPDLHSQQIELSNRPPPELSQEQPQRECYLPPKTRGPVATEDPR